MLYKINWKYLREKGIVTENGRIKNNESPHIIPPMLKKDHVVMIDDWVYRDNVETYFNKCTDEFFWRIEWVIPLTSCHELNFLDYEMRKTTQKLSIFKKISRYIRGLFT